MLPVERDALILQLVEEKTSVSVAELSEILELSEVTIRKVLNEMDHQGLLRRTRGGAVSRTRMVPEFEETEKEKKNIEEKKAIAKEAYALIQDTETIFLDAGSTTLELAKLLRNGNKRNVVVVTNAFNIVNELLNCEDMEVVFIGGCVRHRIQSCVGSLAENALSGMCFDKAFMGCNGLSIDKGITTPNMYEAQVKQKAMESSARSVLLCDHSKVGVYTMFKIKQLKQIDTLIMDWKVPEEFLNQVRNQNVKVIIAKQG